MDEHSENLSDANVLRDALACAVFAVDGRGKITAFSPEAEKITRLKAEDILGKDSTLLPAALQKIIGETISTGKPVSVRQAKFSVEGDEQAEVCVHTTLLASATGKAHDVVVVLNDLTAVRLLEQNMRRLDRLANLGTLSASMAHEIKNAMVAVKTFLDLLLEKNQDAELAEIVGREMKRIDLLVSQTLRVANPTKPTIATVHLHELIDHSLRLVQHQMSEKPVALRRNYAAIHDIIHADNYQLEQAFMNLFLNALEAMGANGELTVTTEAVAADAKHPPRLRIIVQDTGIGIPPENMGHIFETFFTTKKTGTGLGLAITRRIVREHHGEITVESERNKGAKFILLLPLGENKS